MLNKQTINRKDEHIQINLEQDVRFSELSTQLERYQFTHQALPEFDLVEVNSETEFLGRKLSFPLLIGAMTGGTQWGTQINQIIAEAAQNMGIGIGLGSMRVALENPSTASSFQVRKYAPNVLLLANLGAVQLNYGYGTDDCLRAVEMIEADALVLHINPLQEALQPEGNTRFSGLLHKIEQVCKTLPVPVIVKEIGCGLSPRAAQALANAGVSALNIAGAGGTSWSQVEMFRAQTSFQSEVAAVFRNWGIPTSQSLIMARQAVPDIPIIASGGLSTGIDIAKTLALGADVAAMAGALLKAGSTSLEALLEKLRVIRRQLRIAMFVAGARDIPALKNTPLNQEGGTA